VNARETRNLVGQGFASAGGSLEVAGREMARGSQGACQCPASLISFKRRDRDSTRGESHLSTAIELTIVIRKRPLRSGWSSLTIPDQGFSPFVIFPSQWDKRFARGRHLRERYLSYVSTFNCSITPTCSTENRSKSSSPSGPHSFAGYPAILSEAARAGLPALALGTASARVFPCCHGNWRNN